MTNARRLYLLWGDGGARRMQSQVSYRWDSQSLVGARRWTSSRIPQEHSTFVGSRRMTHASSKSEWGALP